MLLLRRLGPSEPRGVAVAIFGHTGLGMLICRNEVVAAARVYAQACIIFHDSASTFTSLRQLLRNLLRRRIEPDRADYAPLGACRAHSGQHVDCPVRRTLREVCYGMQPTASLSRAWRRSDARVPETVVVVLGEVGPLEQRVILPGGQGGRPQKH